MQFLKVWGAAEATCQRWYNAGCRTLDDIRARSDLTEQQVVPWSTHTAHPSQVVRLNAHHTLFHAHLSPALSGVRREGANTCRLGWASGKVQQHLCVEVDKYQIDASTHQHPFAVCQPGRTALLLNWPSKRPLSAETLMIEPP